VSVGILFPGQGQTIGMGADFDGGRCSGPRRRDPVFPADLVPGRPRGGAHPNNTPSPRSSPFLRTLEMVVAENELAWRRCRPFLGEYTAWPQPESDFDTALHLIAEGGHGPRTEGSGRLPYRRRPGSGRRVTRSRSWVAG
jgi:hypothetical protein